MITVLMIVIKLEADLEGEVCASTTSHPRAHTLSFPFARLSGVEAPQVLQRPPLAFSKSGAAGIGASGG